MSSTSDPVADPSPNVERSEFEERLGTKPQKPGLAHRIAAVWKDEYDTAMNWPRGKRHLVARGLTIFVVNTVALLIVAALMDSIRFTSDFWNIVPAALVTLVAGAITFALRPVIFVALGINNVVVTGVLTVFSSVGSMGRYGRWGIKEHLLQEASEAPKFRAVDAFIDATSIWW